MMGGVSADMLDKFENRYTTNREPDAGIWIDRAPNIDEVESSQDADLKRRYAKATASDAWNPLKDQSTLTRHGNTIEIGTTAPAEKPERELTEHQLRLHDKATGRAYYCGRPTDAQVAVQRRQIEHRRAALGAKHGATPGQRPVYSEHQRYGAAYVTAWETARGTLNYRYAKTDESLTALLDSTKLCEWCRSSFLPERSTKRFCCDEHRVYASRDKVYQRPVFRCDSWPAWTAPAPVVDIGYSHDALCRNRRKADDPDRSLRDLCTCTLTWEESVTLRLTIGTNEPVFPRETVDSMAIAA
jgi:hypothetical protein